MGMILNRRILRDFRENFLRNFSMIMIIALSMALVAALCSSTDSITDAVYNEWGKCRVEDGSFETYIPLSNRNMKELSSLNAEIEKMFYIDVPANYTSTLRIFSKRKKINLQFVEEGSVPAKDNEVFIEKNYAKKHNIGVGDSIVICGNSFVVSGVGCLPDYGYVKQNVGDVAADEEFSVAVVTDNAWKKLKGNNKTVYNYAFRLGENCTVKDLKNKLTALKFNPNAVKDTYLKEQIASAENLRDSFDKACSGLKNGSAILAEGIDSLDKNLSSAGIDAPTKELYDGAAALYSGIGEMHRQFGEYIDDNTEFEMVNLSYFGEKKNNIRINDAVSDSQIGKQSALVVGVFLIVLMIYMLSVFASGTIERERSVIGTLYALGYDKKEILSHYIKIPMLTALLGALFGMLGGYFLTDVMSSSYTDMYSFPNLVKVYKPYLLLYAIGMPVVFSYLINRTVLSRKLDSTPLKMMREAPHNKGSFNFRLDGMNFGTKYKIRQFFRELSGNITLFFGITVSILIIMFSVACYGSISNYINGIADDIHCEYTYILRNPVNDLPKNSVVGYARGFNVDYPLTGGEMEVTLTGIDGANPYFDFAGSLPDDSDKVYMSDSVRIKFGYKVGDKVIFTDNSEDKMYAFEIAGEVKYGNGLYFFMNIDAMRKAFGLPYFDSEDLKKGERRPKNSDYYYNTVFSDRKLSFGHNMMMSEISKADVKRSVDKFMTLMWGMIVMLIGVSVIIFVAVMYLLMKLEIDRSSFSISLLKALGYPERTVNSFYLSSSLYVTAAAAIVGIPVCKKIVNVAYPFCVSNVNGGFEASVSPLQYAIIVLIIIISYAVTRAFLVRYLRKIKLTEILKNRE